MKTGLKGFWFWCPALRSYKMKQSDIYSCHMKSLLNILYFQNKNLFSQKIPLSSGMGLGQMLNWFQLSQALCTYFFCLHHTFEPAPNYWSIFLKGLRAFLCKVSFSLAGILSQYKRHSTSHCKDAAWPVEKILTLWPKILLSFLSSKITFYYPSHSCLFHSFHLFYMPVFGVFSFISVSESYPRKSLPQFNINVSLFAPKRDPGIPLHFKHALSPNLDTVVSSYPLYKSIWKSQGFNEQTSFFGTDQEMSFQNLNK